MSRAARFTGVFGDGKHEFALNIGELEELQEKCDAGPEEIMARVIGGTWRLSDIRETLRLGLKGAGLAPDRALVLIERYAGPGQLAALKPLVVNVLGAALVGAPDEDERAGELVAGAAMTSPAES
ncbi:gene transfer agent family protein [Brevundimonas sp.]|jgi:hypothetical protein|uniref:gene transfer agent family protein n=1 Tax=Brevundimonas sp. TaxID=1871086 RepID=UPI003919EB23